MKSVRILYKKQGRARFMSHLDITRFFARIIRRANLPIWYTEGFNPHPYITFALPLSLGFESEYEIADIRLTDDGYDLSEIPELLNAVSPEGFTFVSCFEPTKKTGKVTAAIYEITFDDGGEISKNLNAFLKSAPLFVTKKTKRKEEKQFDVSPHIKSYKISDEGDTVLNITLPAGGVLNINPDLILTAFFEQSGRYFCYKVNRKMILDSAFLPFK